METFHFALKPGGFLFLGSSESIDGANDLYSTISKEYQFFQSRQATARPIPVPDRSITSSFKIKLPGEDGIAAKNSQQQENKALERISLSDLHQRLLEQYAPPSVILNENYDVMHISEKAGKFMQVAGGEPSNNILKLIKPELRLEMRTALYRAMQKQTNIEVKNLSVKTNGDNELINLHVRPVLRPNDTARGFILILFEPSQDKAEKDAIEISPKDAYHLSLDLEEELTRLKTQVRSSNEQFEVQTEELKASNEELQAMNEELRSAAEELETSKEELQSINEELVTVNQELKIKIEEVSQSNNDFQNLINSTDIGTIFLDRHFRVKLFTPAIREIFNLIPADIGRLLSDITNKLDNPNLLNDAESVLKKLQTIEREVRTTDRRTYLMHVSPYRTAEDRINGVVISFINISELKAAEWGLGKSEAKLAAELQKMRDLYESSSRILVTHSLPEAFKETLSVSMHLLEADFGTIQLYDAANRTLKLAAQSGFSSYFKEALKEIDADNNMASGRSIRQRRRIIIEDVKADEIYMPYLEYAEREGYRSVVATPLYGHEHELLGVLTNFFKKPHTPASQDLYTLDLYARQASAFISRARAEEALRSSQERLSVIIETAVDFAIIVTNTSGIIEAWSSGAERTFNFKRKEAVGKPGHIIFTPEDIAANIPEKEMQTAREKGFAEDERWHVRKDGSRFFVSGIMRPIYENNLTGYVKIARDVTEQKLLEQQREDFISIASHELRTPVTSIKAYTELLQESCDTGDYASGAELLKKLNVQVDRFIEMIHSLLDTTRITEGQLFLSPEEVDLNQLIANKIEDLQFTTANHHLKFFKDGSTFIKADKKRIEEVLTNLISNAIKYSPNGGDIIITAEKKQDSVEVSIKDNGIGIAEHEQAKLFGRFFRVKNPQIETYPGMGLGLYIASAIIKQHNGKMWVTSKLHEGSAFHFTLPYQ
jgi:PAS domain S-box-containing protein